MIFEEKKALGKLRQIVLGSQFQKFPFDCCFLTWLVLTVTLQWQTIFKPGVRMCSFGLLKAKNEERKKKCISFDHAGQKPICSFWGPKRILLHIF